MRKLAFLAGCKPLFQYDFFSGNKEHRMVYRGGCCALMLILLAESSTPPRDEEGIPNTTTQKDYRPILQKIKTVPEHLIEDKTERQTVAVKRLSGAPEPANGPIAILAQMEEVHTAYLDQIDISLIETPVAWDAEWLLEIIQQDPSVDYAGMDDKNKRVPESMLSGIRPNDPSFGVQTNLHDPDNDVDVDAPEAWAYTTGSDSVVVLINDGAFDINNPELRPNLWVNSSETAGNGIDDDGNGCVDDIHGCNYDGGRRDGYFGDRAGHGTWVASTIGARGNNNNEIAGVAWNIRMMLLNATHLQAYRYTVQMLRRGVNIRVISYTTAGLDCDPDNLGNIQRMEKEAFEDLMEKGVLFVQSIGNRKINYNSRPSQLRDPACYNLDNIIAVAGQSKDRRERWVRTDFENIGTNYGSIITDLYAPAEGIRVSPYEQGAPEKSGTSYAAPHVAGAAALLWSFKPDLTVTQVRSALLDTVDRFDSFKLKDENGVPTTDTVASGGALNIANALYSVATPGIRIHSSQTTIAEGTSGYIDLSLTREPVRPSTGQVVVLEGVATPLSDAAAVVTPSTLTFTSANWHIPQRMSVRAAGTSGSEITLEVSVDRRLSTTHYQSVPMRTATMTLQSDGIRPTLHMPSRVAEGDITTATIRFSDPLISEAQFTITATGTAVEGADYTLPETITAAPGSTSATFTIETINNAGYNGPDRTIHLQINTDNPHISPSALPPATLTIEDKDTPIMTITVFPRTITQSNTAATAPTATATILLDRRAVSDVRVFLNARTHRRGGDISHLFNQHGNTWPVSATIVENATATEIIIHSLDYDDDLGPSHWIRLYPTISEDTAARLGEPRRATLRTRDDDGDSDTYIRLRVFLEGAVETTPTDTIQPNP